MNRTVWICSALGLLGLLAVAGEFWYLRSRQQEAEARLTGEREGRTEALANELASSRAATGKAYLASRDYDKALKALHEAKATENATNLDRIAPLIVQAERGQAAALLERALSALLRRDVASGQRLLADYLAHPRAQEKERARRLTAGVRQVASEAYAASLLRRLSDEQLGGLDAGAGPAASSDQLDDALLRPLLLATLRTQLPKERKRRADLLAAKRAQEQRLARERAQREARVLASAPYKQMAELTAGLSKRSREERAMLSKQKRALARLVRELGIADPEEGRLRKNLAEGEKKVAAFHQAFLDRRAPARKAFQALKGATAADLEVFDKLLARLAEGLLAAGKP
jgi:hypothetical protein